ncbi:MAG TPA: hypothetical protein VE944_10995 [Nostoc sp.]|uniref:hypothetical protein n=1 Tax=Nostoc sp. TaxID=1180 RepID=UPI002D684320|nr:hypothetical protein [Nostoc sp.]HYX14871.1 hypothetical protein [Nostoc sp.]
MVLPTDTFSDDNLVGSFEDNISFDSVIDDTFFGGINTDLVDYNNLTTATTPEAVDVADEEFYLLQNSDVLPTNTFGYDNLVGSFENNISFDAVSDDTFFGDINTDLADYNNLTTATTPEAVDVVDEEFYLLQNSDVLPTDTFGYNNLVGSFENNISFDSVSDDTLIEIIDINLPTAITLVEGVGVVDEEFYLLQNSDVVQAVIQGSISSGSQHFALFGQFERRDPNNLFDTNFYLTNNPDVKQAVDQGFTTAAQHYFTFGGFEGRDPSASFDSSSYLEINTDVAAAGINPLSHYLIFGMNEGRPL